jgi:predicted Rossmann-fold nucleotide-binding protein
MHFFSDIYDLVTPDGAIQEITLVSKGIAHATVVIDNISPAFIGHQLPLELLSFNIKSTLAQLGLEGIGKELELDPRTFSARVKIELHAIGHLAKLLLPLLTPGAYIGKLFAADDRRLVRDPNYLTRMFGRSDRQGRPLLSLGGMQGGDNLVLEKIEGRTVAFLSLLNGLIHYDPTTEGFLPTLAKALKNPSIRTRDLIHLHQFWQPDEPPIPQPDEILLVRTLPLHIRTVFAKVVDHLLPPGLHHTSASVLQPDTKASGDIYELFGSSNNALADIPLEFYTLEPFREYVFFSDRDQLQICLEDSKSLFQAFDSAPGPSHHLCATFIVKGTQLLNLTPDDWISTDPKPNQFPGLIYPARQALMVERYIQQQPAYLFLKGIEEGRITSQGILLSRYFPSPLMKRMLLSEQIQRCLKGLYFEIPSLSHGSFFSHEDRSLLHDLAKFAIPVFWVDRNSSKILQYVPKPEKDSGMFVPLQHVQTFLDATSFGLYGSNLIEGNFEQQLHDLMEGVLAMRKEFEHPLLNPLTPIAMVTGGGPGTMEIGNRVAKSLGLLSCANIIDFGGKKERIINEQKQNPYIDAKMTFRLDRLVERQAEFHLDFPIFLQGGIGTDFEFALENVRRKVGATLATPVFLLGSPDYWRRKITSGFQTNLATGTIAGSEWVSNCFFCIETAAQGLQILRQFLSGTLPIGAHGPIYEEGFATVSKTPSR